MYNISNLQEGADKSKAATDAPFLFDNKQDSIHLDILVTGHIPTF